MPRQLSDRQQRLVIGVLVVALVGFGVYLYVRSTGEDGTEQRRPQGEDEPESAPSPMDVTATEELEFFDWTPFTEEEFLQAAVTARDFASAYGTFDSAEPPEDYDERLAEFATEDFAAVLQRSTGDSALRSELVGEDTTAQGYAETTAIRYFDEESITFVVDAQSITSDSEGERESLGEFAVTVVPDGDGWLVHDFQPADAGDWGEER